MTGEGGDNGVESSDGGGGTECQVLEGATSHTSLALTRHLLCCHPILQTSRLSPRLSKALAQGLEARSSWTEEGR